MTTPATIALYAMAVLGGFKLGWFAVLCFRENARAQPLHNLPHDNPNLDAHPAPLGQSEDVGGADRPSIHNAEVSDQ